MAKFISYTDEIRPMEHQPAVLMFGTLPKTGPSPVQQRGSDQGSTQKLQKPTGKFTK
jgi:hypothetical protein